MSNLLSQFGTGLSDLAGLAGRGFWGAATLGATELGRMNQREKEEKQKQELSALGSVLGGGQIPAFLRPGGAEAMTPQEFEAAKTQQLYSLGTPEAAAIANKFIETPESRLQKANVESEITNREAQRALQKEGLGLQKQELGLKAQEIANTKEEKLRNYNLAAKELEAKLKGGLTDPKEIFDRETKLRNEFVTQSKDFALQRDAFDRIKTSAKDPSAAGDLALIYNYMKLLDPGSTVREGEFATAQNSGSIPDSLQAKYNKIINGERLDNTIRKDFVDRSDRLYKGAEIQHAKRTDQYKGLANRAGVNPNQVIVDLGLAETKEAPKILGNTPMPGIKFLGFK